MITVTNEQLMEELTVIKELLVKLVSEETKPDINLSSPETCYLYARNILKTRFEAGEKVIATDAWYSYLYALRVLKSRFEAGEKKILNSGYKQRYLKFLKEKGIKI